MLAPVKALRLAVSTVALVAVAASHLPANADVSDRLPKLRRLVGDVERAPNVEAYAALRKLWLEWDQGDPTEVEEALRAAASSRTGSTRVYADLLGAYARRRRGDLEGARQQISRLGYVSQWAVAGPFDNEGKGGFPRTYEPEVDDEPTYAKGYDGKERKVSWRTSPARSAFAWVDLGALVRPNESVCVYASTFVRDPDLKKGQSRTVSVWAGSAGAMRVWWNGTLALEDTKYRDLDSEREGRSVTLQEGFNRVLVKVCGDDDAPVLSLRVGDAAGAPLPRLEIDADLAHAAEVKARGAKSVMPPSAVEGPLQLFDRAAKQGDAATLEAYARYLELTQSDDDAEHLARDLATRAAKKAPTIARLLLAGNLAESRNQRAEWIDQAEALVARGGATVDDRIATLLARAGHVRTSVNFRDAVPYYDAVLVLDRDDVTANLARVELYGEANLRATALASLQEALLRRPRSVALVRAMVGALRQEDRTTEADEMEERYAALRFDDVSYMQGKVDLYIARRDAAQATRWIERMLDVDPDDTEKLTSAAKAYISLGDRSRAIAMYKRALDLAPEDTDAMRALADVYAIGGQDGEKLGLLRKVLELKPQSKDVRDYLAHLEPSKPKEDEVYAVASKDFLAQRGAPAGGKDRRTLVDVTVTTVFPNGLSSKFHQLVYQPLTERAAQDGRNYGFAYESDAQTVQLRAVHVYRQDGTVDDTFDTSVGGTDDPSMAMYTSAAAYRVRFPRLSPGDVVELQYRIEDVAQRNAFADYFGDVAYLQSDEPIARAEYVLLTPKARTFYYNEPKVPNLPKTVEDKGAKRVYRFVATNVPPIETEPLMAPYTEILGYVHVSTYKSWNDMGAWYWGLVKDQFTADNEVRKRVAEITKGKTTDREKVIAVYDYVVQKTRYVALEFGIHGFKPYSCTQIFARGFGDCKDKATLIVTMLKEAGIPATIVVVRTGLRGDFGDSPASLAPFDHAIAYVPGFDLYLDGTAEYTGSTELPAMDRGALAIQINEGKPKLVHLPDPPAAASTTARSVTATLGNDGSAQLDWRGTATGVFASSWRVRYHADALRKQRVQEDLSGDLPGIEVQGVDANDLENVELAPDLKVRARVAQFARRDQGTLSVPVGPKDHMVAEFASLSTRKLDVRLRSQNTQESDYTIKLPGGAKVTAMPTASESQTPFGTHKVIVDQVPGGVRVRTSVAVAKTRITAVEYPAFRAWCEQVDRALGQRLVLSLGGGK